MSCTTSVCILSEIETRAADMQKQTSVNDSRYDGLQHIIGLCREGMDHFIDDGK